MPVPRQAEGELGERAGLAIDRDRDALLLRDDVVADREPEARALARRLRREEGLEEPIAVFGWDADTVVAQLNLDRVAQIPRPHRQHRAEPTIGLALALGGGIEAVADQ